MHRLALFAAAGLGLTVVGCSGNGTTGVFNQPSPRIKVVNAVDGASVLDWEVTGQSNLTFPPVQFGTCSGTATTPYVILNERGTQQVEFLSPSNLNTPIATTTHDFTYGDKLDDIAYGSQVNASTVLLYDETSNSNNGPNVRVVDGARQIGSVDMFISPQGTAPSGTPTTFSAGGVFPAQVGTYTYSPLPNPGSYTITLYPQGNDTGTPLLTFNFTVASTDVWTFVILDPVTTGGNPTILAIQDNNPNAG